MTNILLLSSSTTARTESRPRRTKFCN